MRRTLARVRGLGFILWQARHMGYHILIGLVWAWILREVWGQFNLKWIATAVVGSLLPDIDHLNYFVRYGKNDNYTRQLVNYLKNRQWRMLAYYIATGHKFNTNLSYHNFYIVIILLVAALFALQFDWEVGVVILGAMVLHYLFDVVDDIVQLGAVNPNWKRWGRPKHYPNISPPMAGRCGVSPPRTEGKPRARGRGGSPN